MCYDVASGTRSAIKYAKHRGDDPVMIAELEKQLELWVSTNRGHYQVSGFAHPKLMVFTNSQPYQVQAFQWGLIPAWVKQKNVAQTIMNQTLNARSETMFDKPSFKNPAQNKRCLIYLDAFYEYHHFKGKTYPFHISMKDDTPLCVAGLWDEWVDQETGEVIQTVTIVTTKGNHLMGKIHNNPKLDEARMPLILKKEDQNAWLANYQKEESEHQLSSFIHPLKDGLLQYHTVRRLKGKESPGDVPEAAELFVYPELENFLMEL